MNCSYQGSSLCHKSEPRLGLADFRKRNGAHVLWESVYFIFPLCSTQLESGIPWEVRGVEVERVVGGDKEGRTHRLDLKEFQ